MEGRRRLHEHVEGRHQDSRSCQDGEEQPAAPVGCLQEAAQDHASTARPLSANRPRGRFWMNRMTSTSSAILPSTAPAKGSRSLLATPSVKAPTSVPHRLPTPPNTTTRKLSMM